MRGNDAAADSLERWQLHQRDLEQQLADVVEHIRKLEGNRGPDRTAPAPGSE
jgi:hypothetical protein